MRVSASMLSTWMGCSLQAKFRYVDRLPDESNAFSAFGSCVHHALDYYNKTANCEAAVEEFRRVWDDPALIGSAFTIFPKFTSFSGFMTKGVDMIREYHEKQKWENRIVIASEHRFKVPFGDHELSGIVDLLEMKKSGRGKNMLKVVDYKTNSRQPNLTELKLNVQFTAYHYASMQPEFWLGNGPDYPAMPDGPRLWTRLEQAPRQTYWYHLNANKEINAGERDDRDFMRMYRVVCEMEKALKHDVFVPSISGSTCLYCPYTKPCGVEIPSRDEEVEV